MKPLFPRPLELQLPTVVPRLLLTVHQLALQPLRLVETPTMMLLHLMLEEPLMELVRVVVVLPGVRPCDTASLAAMAIPLLVSSRPPFPRNGGFCGL